MHKMNIKIKKITPEEAILVRSPVLRRGQPVESAYLENDYSFNTIHFGGFLQNKQIATVTIFPENRNHNKNEWRLRGMAVLDKFQSKGIGEKLLKECFKFILSNNGQIIWCNARIKAIEFYKKCGFSICSKKFDIFNIGPHLQMEKKL